MNIFFLLGSVSSKVEAKFDELWWGLSKGLMGIIDMLEQAFTFVVGAGGDFTAGDNTTSMNGTDNLLVRTFLSLFGSEGTMRNVYFSMIIICMGLMIVFVFVGVIKAQFSKDATESIGKMISKGFWSIFKMLLVPVFFFISLVLVGFIFEKLLELMGGGGSRSSLAETLCKCFTTDGKIFFNSKYDDIASNLEDGNFNFVLCILTSACIIVTLTTATIAVTKRFVKIFFYYITAPMVLSKSMIDEGKSWELWKDNLLAQLLGAGGVIIAMYIFIAVVPSIAKIIDDTIPPERSLLASILKIVFIFGMSTVPAGASALMAQLVSQGAGQNESNDLMHTQQMLGNGLKLAGAVAGKAMAGGLAAMVGGGGGGFAARMGGGAGAAAANGGAGAAMAMGASGSQPLNGANGSGSSPASGGMPGAAGAAGAAAGGGASPLSAGGAAGGASPAQDGMSGAGGGAGAAAANGGAAGGASPASFSASGGASPSDGGAGAAGAASGAAAGLNGAIQRNAQAGGVKGALAKNVANHRGGAGFAIMRGGVGGAIGYGIARGVSLMGSAAKYGIGRVVGKLGGDKLKAAKANRAALRADSKANKKASAAQAKANNLGVNKLNKATGPVGNQQANANKFFDAQLQKLAKQGQRVNGTLNGGRMKNASDAQKDQYRQNRMQANINKLQNQMKHAGLSGDAAMQKRFQEAVKGNYVGRGNK